MYAVLYYSIDFGLQAQQKLRHHSAEEEGASKKCFSCGQHQCLEVSAVSTDTLDQCPAPYLTSFYPNMQTFMPNFFARGGKILHEGSHPLWGGGRISGHPSPPGILDALWERIPESPTPSV